MGTSTGSFGIRLLGHTNPTLGSMNVLYCTKTLVCNTTRNLPHSLTTCPNHSTPFVPHRKSNWKGKVASCLYTTSSRRMEGVEALLTSVLDGGKWSALLSGRFTPGITASCASG